jgi:hypothetical protein
VFGEQGYGLCGLIGRQKKQRLPLAALSLPLCRH